MRVFRSAQVAIAIVAMALSACGPKPVSSVAEPVQIGAVTPRASETPAAAILERMPAADLTTEASWELLHLSYRRLDFQARSMELHFGDEEQGALLYNRQEPCIRMTREEIEGGHRVSVVADSCSFTVGSTPVTVDGRFVRQDLGSDDDERMIVETPGWQVTAIVQCADGTRPVSHRYVGSVDVGPTHVRLDMFIDASGWVGGVDGCEPAHPMAIRFEGQDGEVAGGSGVAGIEGVGRVEFETHVPSAPQGYDCRQEAHAGYTRLRSRGRVLEVRYNGATSCDQPGSAPVYLDGQEVGQTDAACNAGGPAGPSVIFVMLALVGIYRRSRHST